jgi:hypothetical protein
MRKRSAWKTAPDDGAGFYLGVLKLLSKKGKPDGLD